MAKWEYYLKDIYFDPKHPASFAGPQKLYKVVKNESLTLGCTKYESFFIIKNPMVFTNQSGDAFKETT